LPEKLATEMVLTGRSLDAAEALAHGLVNRVVEAGTAQVGARDLAAEVLAASPMAVRASLQIMAETRGTADTAEAVAHRSPVLDELAASADTREGRAAFAQKRRPVWQNR
jgi:acetyl-CoA C-acetyltransferase